MADERDQVEGQPDLAQCRAAGDCTRRGPQRDHRPAGAGDDAVGLATAVKVGEAVRGLGRHVTGGDPEARRAAEPEADEGDRRHDNSA